MVYLEFRGVDRYQPGQQNNRANVYTDVSTKLNGMVLTDPYKLSWNSCIDQTQWNGLADPSQSNSVADLYQWSSITDMYQTVIAGRQRGVT